MRNRGVYVVRTATPLSYRGIHHFVFETARKKLHFMGASPRAPVVGCDVCWLYRARRADASHTLTPLTVAKRTRISLQPRPWLWLRLRLPARLLGGCVLRRLNVMPSGRVEVEPQQRDADTKERMRHGNASRAEGAV